MEIPDSIVAVFAGSPGDRNSREKADAVGLGLKNLSVVGRSYHSEEQIVGPYNIGDRMKFWGVRVAFWGGLSGLLMGGLLVTAPIVVLGYLTSIAISMRESAVIVGRLSAIGAAYAHIGVPKDGFFRYEAAVKADGFLEMSHGTAQETIRARAIFSATSPSRLDVHSRAKPEVSITHRIHASG
jgi:hypothetical protein